MIIYASYKAYCNSRKDCIVVIESKSETRPAGGSYVKLDADSLDDHEQIRSEVQRILGVSRTFCFDEKIDF